MALLSEPLTVASSSKSKINPQENGSSSICVFILSNEICWFCLLFREHSTCGMLMVEKMKHVLKSLGVPCLEVKIDAFPPSSDCEANDGQMLESSWERLHVRRKAVQTQAQVSDSEL